MTQVINAANVAVADFITPDSFNQYNDAASGTKNRIYEKYVVEINYITSFGILQMPVASSSTVARFANTSNTISQKIVRFDIIVNGNQPLMPTPYSSDSNEVLMDTRIVTKNIESSPDGAVLRWSISGEYTYGIVDETKVTIVAPAPPFLAITLAQTSIDASSFVTGITSTSPPSLANIKDLPPL